MNFKEILNDIENNKYAPIYLLHGDEEYYIDQIASKLEHHVLDDSEKAFNQVVAYGRDIDFKTVVDEARQFPMMASKRVVIIKEAQDMRTIKELAHYAENPAEHAIVVLVYKHKRMDMRSKLAKAIKSKGVVFESKKLYDNQVPVWINEYLSIESVRIDGQAAMLLAEYVGADLSKLSNELNKLMLNVGKDRRITSEDISQQVGISKDYNVFELQKAIGNLDVGKVFRIVDYFSTNSKAHPLVLTISSLFNYFQKVYITAYHQRKNDQELKSLLGLPTPYFVKEYRQAIKHFNGYRLVRAFEHLKKADLQSKGVGARNLSDREILRNLMLNIFYN